MFPLLLFGALIYLSGATFSSHLSLRVHGSPRIADKTLHQGVLLPSHAPFLLCLLQFWRCATVSVQAYSSASLSSSFPSRNLEHLAALLCLSLASFNGLPAVASPPPPSPTLHADDLLVGALWRNISSFLGLFSPTAAAAALILRRERR